jgi:hypothetical protein
MNEKRKLILHFGLDCLFIVLMFLTMVTHYFALGIALCGLGSLVISKISLSKKNKQTRTEKTDRKLTTPEVIAAFAIGISALYLGFFAIYKGLLNNMAFTIPICVILLAVRLFSFAKDLAASQTPKPASN